MTTHRSTRRTFLKQGAICTAGAATPLFGMSRYPVTGTPTVLQHPTPDDPATKVLVQRAIDAAISSGATYADVRLTQNRSRIFQGRRVRDSEEITAGVRVLADGSWGFASSPIWSGDEMVRLGQDAALQAKAGGLGERSERALAPTAVVANGHWTMPVQIDPFDVPIAEISDFLVSLGTYVDRIPGFTMGAPQCQFDLFLQAFGSSEGSYWTQQRYLSRGQIGISKKPNIGLVFVDGLSPAGVGWELIKNQHIREAIRDAVEELRFDLSLPTNPVEIGRYETVFDAGSIAVFLNRTIGLATELDRVLGYEANAGGTSYITEPDKTLGTLQLGAPSLNITANRNAPGAAATVQWDDEGVAPSAFTIVGNGKLEDVSTTRESVMWLRDRYTALKRPLQSHGCAFASSALCAPLSSTPNLEMIPGTDTADFETLIGGIRSGIAFKGIGLDIDFQQLNGLGIGNAYEIRNGKRVAHLANAGMLFRSPEFWKSIMAIGGRTSSKRYGQASTKGEPPQQSWRSITAVPIVCKDVTVIDAARKA